MLQAPSKRRTDSILIGPVLPAMGYSPAQIRDLEETINRADGDLVVFATPIQLTRILSMNKPTLRVRYEYKDHGQPILEELLLSRMQPWITQGQSESGR
jgi:predicted GTPase